MIIPRYVKIWHGVWLRPSVPPNHVLVYRHKLLCQKARLIATNYIDCIPRGGETRLTPRCRRRRFPDHLNRILFDLFHRDANLDYILYQPRRPLRMLIAIECVANLHCVKTGEIETRISVAKRGSSVRRHDQSFHVFVR